MSDNQAKGTRPAAKAAVIFSSSLAQELNSSSGRLATNYIGLRRVRPSSRSVQDALRSSSSSGPPVVVEFKVMDEVTGEERRMTAKEKKEYKNKLKLEKAREKQALKKRKAMESVDREEDEKDGEEAKGSTAEPLDEGATREESSTAYLQLTINQSALKQELADIRGERVGVPPVMLSPAQTYEALASGILARRNDEEAVQSHSVVFDQELSSKWATVLKDAIVRAETARQQEKKIRPMPYVLKPEAWTRFRPLFEEQPSPPPLPPASCGESIKKEDDVYVLCDLRPVDASRDTMDEVVVQLLHRGTSLHLSCGAKFGCDYLVYDGPRNERHAFAGLRVVGRNVESDNDFPVPSSYDMAGYVRSLNTAGKLALLATVFRNESSYHVAVVDLTLEKILATSFSGRSGKKTPKHLSKTKNQS